MAIQILNFRATSGYVTDGANSDYVLSSGGHSAYPFTTAQGWVVGWEGTVATYLDARDRDNTIDVRLAGINFAGIGSDLTFRVDLPSAGNYNIGIAAGDASNANTCAWDLKDTTTLLTHLTTGTTTSGLKFKDASNTELTDVTWPAGQAFSSQTFSSTILRLYPVSPGALTVIANLSVEFTGGAPAATRVGSMFSMFR